MSKDFDYIVASRDLNFETSLRAIKLVQEFIAANGLIIYGGSAIDYALRLCGDKIYPDEMLSIPDLDFMSPNSVADAYRLADILYKSGCKDARAIVAQHVETMRVDAGDNHFIADITYVPASIFPKIPTLTYNGMKIVHPDYQRVDLHSSLAFPFANPPREVIFDRWRKDISRFNILAKYYPIKTPNAAVQTVKTRSQDHKLVFTGFAAYSLVYNQFLVESAKLGLSTDGILAANVAVVDGVLVFDSDGTIEYVHMDMEKALKNAGATAATSYDPYINLQPARAEYTREGVNYIVYELRGQLVGVGSATVGGKNVRFTGVQYTMKHFLAKYFMSRDQPRAASIFLAYYVSLLEMVRRFDAGLAAASAGDELVERAANSIFFPSINVYGSDNINLARSVALSRLRHEIYGEELIGLPQNYYPFRMKEHPTFDPVSMEFFHEEGKKRD